MADHQTTVPKRRTDTWWRCYYAAFAKVHKRQSDRQEFDGNIGTVVDAVLGELERQDERI